MEHRPREIDVPEVPGALGHRLATGLALVVPIDCTKTRVRKTPDLELPGRIILDLGKLDFAHGESTLEDVLV